ncbi:MAG: hypothetical protein FJZ01_08495 [Candidatus Sericytochromatia bacterium]|nr:hypothetical protein [Candidatus Tanganyikabacteria bacterium]
MARVPLTLPAAAGTLALVGCNLLNAPAPTPPATPTPAPTTAASPTPTPGPSATPRPTKAYLFVINGGSTALDKVDLSTGTVTKGVLTLGQVMNQLQVDGTTGYAVSFQDNKVFKLDLAAGTKLPDITFPANTGPQTLTPLGSGKGLVAADYGQAAIFVDLGTGAVEASVSVGAKVGMGGTAVTGGKAYVPVYKFGAAYAIIDSAIKVVDLTTKAVTKTIALAGDANPYATVVAPDGKVHVPIKTGVMTIDPATDATASIAIGGQVTALQFVGSDKAYGLAGYDGLVVYNPATGAVTRNFTNRIKVGGSSGNFKIRGNFAYIPNGYGTDTVGVVDLTTEATTSTVYKVGTAPQDVAIVDVPQ